MKFSLVGGATAVVLLLAAIVILAAISVSFVLPDQWPSWFRPAHPAGWYWMRFVGHVDEWWQTGSLGWVVLVVVLVGWTLFFSLRARRERRGKT